MQTHNVLVTDANGRTALAIIRSLGCHGIRVTAMSDETPCSGFLSRYCARKIVCPSPEKAPHAFLDFLMAEIQKEKYDLVFSASEFTTILMSTHKQDIERHALTTVAPMDKFRKTHDKAETFRIAAQLGVPTPKTLIPESLDQVKSLADQALYPSVIKPRMKSMLTDKGFMTFKVTADNYVQTPSQLVERYRRLVESSPPLQAREALPLIQECIQGDGCGFESISRNGTPTTVFMHRRLREYPITGGASTYRESVFIRDLFVHSERLLAAIGWDGASMVEFKLDRRDGVPKLLEINGRLWGSLPLALAAGVEIPYLIYRFHVENFSPAEIPSYPNGVRSHWSMPGEWLWLFAKLRAGAFREIPSFLGSCFNLTDDVMSLRDPLPYLGAIAETFTLSRDVLAGRKKITGEVTSKSPSA